MKLFLCILVISMASIQEMVIAGKGPPRFDTNMCCNVEKPEPDSAAHEEMKQQVQQCIQELGYDKEENQKQHGKIACISECISKKTNMVDASGNINEAEFINLVKNKFASGDHQKAVAEDVAKKCIEEAKTKTDEVPKADDKCSHLSIRAKMCVGKELFKSCPADKQDTSEKCVKLREMINSGKHPKGPQPEGSEESSDV